MSVNLLSMRWFYSIPLHVLNGITVALGIAVVVLCAHFLYPEHAAQWVFCGAVFASLADVPNTVQRCWRRVLFAGLSGALSACVVAWLLAYTWQLGLAIMVLAWMAAMWMSWGPRAGPIAFAPILAMVFTMGQPVGQAPLPLLGWHLVGVAMYCVWALFTTYCLRTRLRSLALANAVQAMMQVLRSRARALDNPHDTEHLMDVRRAWVQDEAALADRLQSARDFLFIAPHTPRSTQECAVLLHVIELRDILLASQLDLGVLGHDPISARIRRTLGERLRLMAAQLYWAQSVIRSLEHPHVLHATQNNLHTPHTQTSSLLSLMQDMAAEDPRRHLLPALTDHLEHMERNIALIHATLCGQVPQLPLKRQELEQFVVPERWPLSTLRAHLTLDSSVMRHAMRSSIALGAAYFLALSLPWTAHPQWLILSVAVVLRGNLEQTLARRNLRIIGTLIGCVLVMGLAHIHSYTTLMIVFLIATGLAHAFVLERYLITATAATVMALLQTHLMHPDTGFPVMERMADTFLGACIAWGFCFFLPSWERKSLPKTLQQILTAMRNYARQALEQSPDNVVPQRLARRQAYDALAALAWVLQRSSVEPRRVQVPVAELTTLLNHAQRLMAHLLMIRLSLMQRADLVKNSPQLNEQLEQAQQHMHTALALQSIPSTDPPLLPPSDTYLEMLPTTPSTQDLAPWLEMRLRIAVHDSRLVAQAAQSAQAQLMRSTTDS